MNDGPRGWYTSRAVRWTILLAGLLGVIIVPFLLFGEAMDAAVREALASYQGGIGLLIAALLALDVLLPVPSSLLSTAAGSLLGVVGGALASWLGMTLGCELGYHLGRRAGRGAMQRVAGERDWARVEAATRRHGPAALALLRAVPVLAEASVLFAGATRMPRGRFFAFTTVANLILSSVYAMIGAYARGAVAPG